MKKRVFMLAVLAGVLLSFASSALAAALTADTWYYKISKFEDTPSAIYNAKIGDSITVHFNIVVEAKGYPQDSNITEPTDMYKNANLLKWKVVDATNNSDVTTGDNAYFEIEKDGVTVTNSLTGAKASGDDMSYLLSGTALDDGEVTKTLSLGVDIKVKVLKNGGKIKVIASLWDVDNGAQLVDTDNQKRATEKNDSKATLGGNDGLEVTGEWGYADDPANPDSAKWDGKDPVFESNPGNNTTAKAKPKLGKIEKTALTFTAGTPGELSIPISGPVTEVDVYIAAKDAIKLGWLPKGSTTNIRLNQDNIEDYKIPFRITSYDFSGNTGLTGDSSKEGKKADKETAKNMSSTLTLAFNGGYFSYKGFPLTISLKNKETSKAVAKAIKINVEPNTNTPQWWFNDYHDVETAVTNAQLVTETTTDGVTTRTAKTFSAENVLTDTNISFDEETRTTSYVNGDDLAFKLSKGNAYYDATTSQWKVSTDVGDATDITATISGTHIDYDVGYDHVIDTKNNKEDKKLEIAIPLVAGDENLGKLSEAAEHLLTYYISGDYGPFVITQKGADKSKNGIVVEITSPDFNYRGEIGKDNEGEDTGNVGSVTFSGKLLKTDKENKTAVTLTVSNAAGKKGTAKITVIGKVPASFDVKKYPVSKDGNRWFTTKPVEAGKIPSVKPKATGSKTITYYVGDWQLDELNTLGLSFDEKKGAVVAYPKGTKNTIPTSNDGVYAPMELVVYATNGVGNGEYDDASAHTMMGITGAKPSLNVKKVDFAGTEYVNGTIKTFALNAGKTKPAAYNTAGANVIVSPDSAGKSALDKLGLEMITWKSVMALESTDVTATDGMEIVKSGDKTPYKLLSGDKETVLAQNVYANGPYTKKNANTGVVSVSIDKKPAAVTAVWLRKGSQTTTEPDENYKNMGIIRVTNASKMKETKKAKINVTLDNIGAAGKGTIELNIAAKVSSDNKATLSAAYVETGTGTPASVKARKGSAGLTGNAGPNAQAEAEAKAESEEAAITFGAPRTIADLSAAQKAFLAEKGYTVIAVLPEITAKAEGQQDIDVELDEEAPEGEKLIWLPFPKDAGSEDDDIVDFYDEAGALVEGVPASHKIIASPWFREGVTYEPVIAIEAE
ncbi:MAG: hypothetical protein IJR85_01875 [Synergistaceae bacterium]|nr:hypothetical protein [Synergistaceae bacterium]